MTVAADNTPREGGIVADVPGQQLRRRAGHWTERALHLTGGELLVGHGRRGVGQWR